MLKNEKLKFVYDDCQTRRRLKGDGKVTHYVLDSERINDLFVSNFIKMFNEEVENDGYESHISLIKIYFNGIKDLTGILSIDGCSDYLESILYKLTKNKKIVACELIEYVHFWIGAYKNSYCYEVFLTIDI